MAKETRREYSNGELTVIWQAHKCVHAGECVRALPQVYDPNARPWISVNNASTEDLIEQIHKCPSGALSYRLEK